MEKDYRLNHTGIRSVGNGYDERLFGPGHYEYEIWQAEKALLREVLERHVPERGRLLDFACGTGRLLAFLEERFEEAIGLDISPTMLAGARPKLSRAALVCGDATRDPGLVEGAFDFVTAFRFFLNAQEDLREEAMAWLASKLRDEHSVLFFNVHGNYHSTRQLSARFKWLQGKEVNWMRGREIRRLVRRHGLEIVDEFGRGYMDKFVYKHVPRFVWRGLENACRRLLPEKYACNLYFACRRAR